MKCEEAEKRIYLYRELSEKEQRELDQHVITCKSCQQVMQGMRHVEALLRKSIEVNPQPKNPQLLTQRILTSIKKKEKHAGFSELLDYLDNYFTKYAFAALSIILVTFFINEYSQEEVILQQNLARKQNGPTLNTAALHEKFQQRRQHKEDQPISLYAYYKKLYTDKSI
jgi:Putative zinc-finger